MRKVLLVLLALAVLGAMGSQYWADDFSRDSEFNRYWPRVPNDPFGKRIAGVFIGSFDFLGNVAPFIQTYNEDGTAQTSTTNPHVVKSAPNLRTSYSKPYVSKPQGFIKDTSNQTYQTAV